MKTLGMLLLFLSFTFKSFAGVGEGGGHPLEAAFKDKLIGILDGIADMSPGAKKLLKFNYESLNVIALLEISVLCADDEQMETLNSYNKLAWVFKENSRQIRIDCSPSEDIQRRWNKRLSSDSYVDHIFFLHEGLRAQNELDDDNYLYSASYAEAYRKNIADEDEDLFRLMRTRNGGCSLEFFQTEDGQTNMAALLYKGKRMNVYRIGEGESLEESEFSFLNADIGEPLRARRKILNQARSKRCLN